MTSSVQKPITLPKTSYLQPDWPAPENIVALTTTRCGGASTKAFDSFNLALHVDDTEQAVLRNRAYLEQHCEGLTQVQWLEQVHGISVVEAGSPDTPVADGCYTRDAGLACAIMTADCLPLLFCDERGEQVAAAHAGWRGLQAGVIEETVATFVSSPQHLLVWLGPAISQACFEVGAEVRAVFLAAAGTANGDSEATDRAFLPNKDNPGHYFANLYQLARLRLRALGITRIYGGNECTFTDRQRFYSYRRDGLTGRMASLIYKL